MPKIKIGFCCRHSGFIRVMKDLWAGNFDVRLRERDPANWGIPLWRGDEDVFISTLHHLDMLDAKGLDAVLSIHGPNALRVNSELLDWRYDKKIPLIMYCTNPLLLPVREQTFRWLNEPWFHPIGAEDCYRMDTFCPVEKFIPFSLRPSSYPTYRGATAKALVVQRKPTHRLNAVLGGIASRLASKEHPYQSPKKIQDLDQLMQDIPYYLSKEPRFDRFVKAYSEYRVLFYWSDSPYSIVLFEAMTAGIPIVAMRTPYTGDVDPLGKYLPKDCIYTDLDAARARIRKYLADPAPPPIRYSFSAFEDIREEWRSTITEIVEGFTAH